MLYRIHQRLLVDSTHGVFVEGGEGCVHTLDMVSASTRAILLESGAISEVQAPPLSAFERWAGRARKMDELGIDTIAFVTMDAHEIAYAIRASTRKEDEEQEEFDRKVDRLAVAVERWQHEIKMELGIGSAELRR